MSCKTIAFSLDFLIEMNTRACCIFSLFIWFCIAVSSVGAQEPAPYNVRVERMTFHPDQPAWMNLFVDVTDSDQRAVTGLDENSFTVQDNQNPAVKPVRAEPYVVTDRPMTYLILLEPNQEIPTSLTLVQDAIARFVEAMGFRYNGAVASYLDRFQILAGSQENQVRLTDLLYAITPQPGSPKLLDGMMAGLDYLIANRPDSARMAMIVFTEGRDADSLFSFEAVQNRILESGITLIVAGYGDPELELHRKLENLARQSGGASYFSTLPDELPGILQTAAERLKNQYVITYPSTAVQNGEAITRVAVTVKTNKGRGEGILLVDGPSVNETPQWWYYAGGGGLLVLLIGCAVWFSRRRNKKQ